MKHAPQPRTTHERNARRNYLWFCGASALGIAVPIGAVSLYLI
jgi:hypothetical protein